MIPLLVFLFSLPALFAVIELIKFFWKGKRIEIPFYQRAQAITSVIFMPWFYLFFYDQNANNCCGDSATFSHEHKVTLLALIALCIITYFISFLKKRFISPVVETLINSTLIGGIVLNIFISIQVEQPFWLFGNLPIVILFIFELIKNNKLFIEYSSEIDQNQLNPSERLAWSILNAKLIYQVPILLIITLPIFTAICTFLMLFGQKPDAIIRAFTDTYKHGFSQLDYMCDNVQCGGHFLCSVPAKGHPNVVSPKRLGERGGNKIMCNRQLLIANAFEELIEERLPKSHMTIRRNYNKVGSAIHKHYHVFNIKWVADVVYIIMKPLEWIFLFTLYTFDRNPENRIAQQYLKPLERKAIRNDQ